MKRELARKKRLHALYESSYEYSDLERRKIFDELLSMRGKTLNSAEADRMIELIHKLNRTGDDN